MAWTAKGSGVKSAGFGQACSDFEQAAERRRCPASAATRRGLSSSRPPAANPEQVDGSREQWAAWAAWAAASEGLLTVLSLLQNSALAAHAVRQSLPA